MLDTFSMASMTDVVFLLLVFFMVTSTFVFPTALDVNLPESNEQTPVKPITRIYIQADGEVTGQFGDAEPTLLQSDMELANFLVQTTEPGAEPTVALYGDAEVSYGRVVEILNIGAENNVRMVLATKQTSGTRTPEDDESARTY